MKKPAIFILISVLFVCLLSSATCFAGQSTRTVKGALIEKSAETPKKLSAGAPTRAIRDMIEYMKQYRDENTAELSGKEKKTNLEIKNKISKILDIPEMARLILINHWEKLTQKEQTKYAGLMVKLVETIAYPRAEEYFNSGLTMKYNDENILKDNKAIVKSTVIYEEKDFDLSSDFYLHKENSRWRIYNIITEGESLLLIYQNQHMRIIKEKGFPHLIELMERKLKRVAGNEK